MKRKIVGIIVFLAFCSFVIVGCGLSTEQLTNEVREAIEETWKEQDIQVKIEDFTLVKKSKTEYKGILNVSAYGEKQTLTVNVTVDGKSFMWEIDD
jgi:biotin-(acetyl-CoA carboxylase) ligase